MGYWEVLSAPPPRTQVLLTKAKVANIDTNMRLYDTDEGVKANWDSLQAGLRCCGGKRYETAFTLWESTRIGSNKNDVPDSCCHEEFEGCGRGKLADYRDTPNQDEFGIWKDGCIEILEVMLKRDLVDYPFAWVYIAIGLVICLVELITVVLACAYVAQINRWVVNIVTCTQNSLS